MYKILIIEDDILLREDLAASLAMSGYMPLICEEISMWEEQLKKERPDLILMDVTLPQSDGYTLCKQIRRQTSIPVIFLTSRESEMDEVYALSIGGDDFIRKPYSLPVLLARISMVLKRSAQTPAADTGISYKDLRLVPGEMRLYRGSSFIELSRNELHILAKLFAHPGTVYRRTDLIEYLWDNQDFIDDNTLSVNMPRLRGKLKDLNAQDLIKTKYGQGYYL